MNRSSCKGLDFSSQKKGSVTGVAEATMATVMRMILVLGVLVFQKAFRKRFRSSKMRLISLGDNQDNTSEGVPLLEQGSCSGGKRSFDQMAGNDEDNNKSEAAKTEAYYEEKLEKKESACALVRDALENIVSELTRVQEALCDLERHVKGLKELREQMAQAPGGQGGCEKKFNELGRQIDWFEKKSS